MKLGIINSAFQQVGVDTVTGLRHIARIGFDTVDIFTEALGISEREVRLVGDTTQKLGLPIVSLPVVAVGLIDFNEPVREFHVERCKKFIDLAQTWRARNILLVLGEYTWQREVIPAAAQWNWGLDGYNAPKWHTLRTSAAAQQITRNVLSRMLQDPVAPPRTGAAAAWMPSTIVSIATLVAVVVVLRAWVRRPRSRRRSQ